MRPNRYTPTESQLAKSQMDVSKEMFRQMVHVNIAGGHRFTYSLAEFARHVRTPSIVIEGLEKAETDGVVAFDHAAFETLKSLFKESEGQYGPFVEAVEGHPIGPSLVRKACRPAKALTAN